MSKEWLEELKKMRLSYEVCFVDDYASAIDDVTADFDLLIERVQELEEENERLRALDIATTHELNYVDRINKRYREALEEIKELTRFDDGSKEKEYEIACKALEGEE